ncbi:hypothetical protein KAR26_00735 [Candidatus Parcubacteria bacterium]|nr:hypothetical protein [Candidatus Parcubacteria bacterium]
MIKHSKTFIIALVLSLLLMSIGGFVFSQTDLEVDYPVISGESPTSTRTFLHSYIKYIFNFAIIACGLIALGVIVRAGAQYTASRGNPASHRDARDRIICGIVGLLILLSSYILLSTINPNLVFFSFAPLTHDPEALPLPEDYNIEPKITVYEFPLGTLINNKNSVLSISYSAYEGILNPARLQRLEKTGDALERANKKLEKLMEVLHDESLKLKNLGLFLKAQSIELATLAADCKCSNCSSDCTIFWVFGGNKCDNCTNDGCHAMTACSACNTGPITDTCPDRARMDELRDPFNIIDGIPEIIANISAKKPVVEEELKRVELFAGVIDAFLSKSDTNTVEAFETTNSVEINALFILDTEAKDLISKADRTGLKEIEQDYGSPEEIIENLTKDLVSLEEIEMIIKLNPYNSIMSYYSFLETEKTNIELKEYRDGEIEPGGDPATFYYVE